MMNNMTSNSLINKILILNQTAKSIKNYAFSPNIMYSRAATKVNSHWIEIPIWLSQFLSFKDLVPWFYNKFKNLKIQLLNKKESIKILNITIIFYSSKSNVTFDQPPRQFSHSKLCFLQVQCILVQSDLQLHSDTSSNQDITGSIRVKTGKRPPSL